MRPGTEAGELSAASVDASTNTLRHLVGMRRAVHGSSEGHEMLKRSDKYHSIADDVPIPKMYFLSKSVDGLFQKLHFCF